MMSQSTRPPIPGWVKQLAESPWVEPLLGALVAVFGIATAASAYQASQYGSNSSENYFVAQSSLTDSSFFFDQANQTVQKDFDILTEIEVQTALGAPQEALDSLANALSVNALDSFGRSGDLDDQYYSELYDGPQEYEDRAQAAFSAGKVWDDLGDQYELLGLILAIGLGFAGWAGLLDRESTVRYVFAFMAVLALILSIVMTVDLVAKPVPPMYQTVTVSEPAP